ncbi:sigma-70 family RNA polymerase sigma factor [Paenibacillus lentus]|uniref:Sigma-70 family RNA polymerase sigma factor n=1 Tax=Paenibacillus lentus TaxID=1338368 RepID=A0A3S8RZU7_9BACL|nr:sigma-70 family RNA polymerase sigma factor [Paenibacillus lentus]AZK48473.1 sigma-70 family RNA polymerase sigma factor [Paenibacillus lentus]
MNAVRYVKKAKRGNKEALLQLILAEKDQYYRLALTYMGNSHDAMDAMEEMIVRLYENISQLNKEEAFYSWSKTILVNCCKAMLRKKAQLMLMEDVSMHDELIAGQDSPPSDPYRHSDQQIDIQKLLLHLNEQQQEAIQLKYWHDLDYQTIAEITNVPIGTVKSRIFQGLKKLRELYGGEMNESH